MYVVESIRGQGLSLPRFLPCFPFPWLPRSTGRRPEYRKYRQPVQSGSGCLHPRDWRIVFATFLIGTGSPCLQIVGDLFHLREVDIFRYRRFQSDGGGGGLELRVTFHAVCLVRHVLHGERGAWSSVHRNGSGARLSCFRWGVGVLRWGEAMAAGVAVRIFVWIRRLAYRIDGARLGIVRCWGLAAVGGLGLICWLACCFFFVGRGCRVFLVPRYLLFSGFLLFLRYLTTKISVILSMST